MIALRTQVSAGKGKEKSNRSNNSRNIKLKRKCMYCCKPSHKEHEYCKKKVDKAAAIEKK
jgi:hypothetical protein